MVADTRSAAFVLDEVELDGRGGPDRPLRLRALASAEGVAPYR